MGFTFIKGGGPSASYEGSGGSSKLGAKGYLDHAINFAGKVWNHKLTQKVLNDGYNHFSKHPKYGKVTRAVGKFANDGNVFSAYDNVSKGIHHAKNYTPKPASSAPNRGIKRPAEQEFRQRQRSMQRPSSAPSRDQFRKPQRHY